MKRLQDDINELTSLTLDMGNLALSMLETSVKYMDKDDPGLVEKMKEAYGRIEKLDDDIENKAFRILMIYQPMSGDMRLVATVLKMITYFERIGKYGYNVSKYSIRMRGSTGTRAFKGVAEMGAIATEMVRGTMESLKDQNISRLNGYDEMEDKLDELRKCVVNEALEYMKANPDKVDDGNSLISVSRYLERTGDYACKLVQKITYMVSGKRIDID